MCKMYIVENLRYINCYIYGDVIMIKGGVVIFCFLDKLCLMDFRGLVIVCYLFG